MESEEATAANPEATKRPPPILCLGVARTGTSSLGEALEILGYKNIHHGGRMKPSDPEWEIFDRAADASFPSLPTYTGNPFIRADWDEIALKYDAVTDVFAYYATSLIAAYPDAKVILVEREIENWHQSWNAQKKTWYGPIARRFVQTVEPLTGTKSGSTAYKFITGWIGSNRRQDIFDKAPEAYKRHYREVREGVRKENLLEYQLSEGWEPLCQFLGKDVPEAAFPRVNELAAYQARASTQKKQGVVIAMKRFVGLESSF